MKVSIITVSYNSENTIKNTIESVLMQTYSNIEYIIIDGASTDNTVNIAEKYKNKFNKQGKNMIIKSEKDSGIYDAMNKGIRLASGDIIGILNSDDIYDSNNVISKIVEIFNKRKCDCVFGDLYYVSRNNTNKIIRYWKSSPYIYGAFKNGWHPPHPTFFVKKEIYEKYGYYDDRFKISADFEMMLRLLENYKINSYYFSEVLVRMRYGGESNRNLKKILIGNYYILKAFKKNKIKINVYMYPIKRLFPKLKQFLK